MKLQIHLLNLMYSNIVGFMIKAIENEYNLPKKYKNTSNKKSKDSFHNFKERNYDYDELEKKLRKN